MARTRMRTKRADGQRGHHVTHLLCMPIGATQVWIRLTPAVQDYFDSSTIRRLLVPLRRFYAPSVRVRSQQQKV